MLATAKKNLNNTSLAPDNAAKVKSSWGAVGKRQAIDAD
jgi:hypothetical protein